MEKNMQKNFEMLERRVIDALDNTDLKFIENKLVEINKPAIITGVGGSSVVSEFTSRVLAEKNHIIAVNKEPRDMIYGGIDGFYNVISCSCSGNNYGVELSFNNNLIHYLLSNNKSEKEEIISLQYKTTLDKEKSFISLGATLIPISIILNYYINSCDEFIRESLVSKKYEFSKTSGCYEIFTGRDTSVTSKYLESTLVESGIGIPVIHDKYSFCHGRSTLATKYNNMAIYLNKNTELDQLLLTELQHNYHNIIVINSNNHDPILDDYQMLVQAMYLTKYIAEQQQLDLSGIDYHPVVKKIYRFNGQL